MICNICKNKKFIIPPWLNHKSSRRMCVYCRSLSRHRAFIKLYEKKINNIHNFSNKKCIVFSEKNNHRISYYLKNRIKTSVITADIEPGYNIRVNLEKMSNINDNSYDYVFLFHVLSVIKNEIEAIKEIHRILKPGGCLFINDGLSKKYKKINYSYSKNNVTKRLHDIESLPNILSPYFETEVNYETDPITQKKETYFISKKILI